MPTIRAEATVQDLLDAVAQLPLDELPTFVQQVAALRASRIAATSSADEPALLHQIHATLPEPQHSRYDELRVKLEDETLTDDEHDELLCLTDAMEVLQVKRAEAIVQLAGLRGLPPVVVFREFSPPDLIDG